MSSNFLQPILHSEKKQPFTKQLRTTAFIGSIGVLGLGAANLCYADLTIKDIDNFGVAVASAANAKSTARVGNLISDDALISVSRKGKTSTLNKDSYLNLLQSNWSKANQYSYGIQINNIVLSGKQAKADATTTETIIENNLTTRLVTTSRITFVEGSNGAILSRAISQLVIEQH